MHCSICLMNLSLYMMCIKSNDSEAGSKMNTRHMNFPVGNEIEILELRLKIIEDRLELSLKLYSENMISEVIFNNVSRFRVGEISTPLVVHGFEIIDHSQNGWEKDSRYEIRDFEDDRINFFCESFKLVR